MRTIKRNTRLRDKPCYEERMQKVAELLGLSIGIYQHKTRNLIFHVDVELRIVLIGEESAMDKFEEMIEETETKTIK